MNLDPVAALLRLDAPTPFAADDPFRSIRRGTCSPVNHGGDATAVTYAPANVRKPRDETWLVRSIAPAVLEPTFSDADHDLVMRVDGIRKLVRTLLFVIFRLEQITSDPAMLCRAVANGRFFRTLSIIASRADTLRALASMTKTGGCSTPSIYLFHRALQLSLDEHDKLVNRLMSARALHEKGLLGLFLSARLEFDNYSVVTLYNVIPLLNMLMDQETKKKAVGAIDLRALGTGNEAGTDNAALQKGEQRGTPERLLGVEPAESQQDDTVYSLDLSAAADKMLLPSRDLYLGKLESLTLVPTLH